MSVLKTTVQELTPPAAYALIASIYFVLLPWKTTRIILPRHGFWFVWEGGDTHYTVNRRLIGRGSKPMRERKYRKYTCDGFVEVEAEDMILEVGAFVGEFTVPAAKRAARVVSFEPDRRAFQCLQRNVANLSNVSVHNYAISDETGTVQFLAAGNPTESSLLDVDVGSYEQVEVDAWRLDDVVANLGIEEVDFLKIEAEGAEPEVLEPLADIEVRKVVVAADAERFSRSPLPQVQKTLERAGYEVRIESPMIFAHRPDMESDTTGTVSDSSSPPS